MSLRDVGDVGLADKRDHMMLAVTVKLNIADEHQLVIALNLFKGPGENVRRILRVPREVFVKRLHRQRHQIILLSENPDYAPRYILEGDELLIWGVVRNSIRWYSTSDKA